MDAQPADLLAIAAQLAGHITLFHAVVALACVNLAAFMAFGIDKARARDGHWRVQESTLLGLALLGGTIGAWSGRKAFRHKTRKEPFNTNLVTITALQIVVAGLFAAWWTHG